MRRRSLLAGSAALAALLPGCSVLPERPYREVRRFALTAPRPSRAEPSPAAPVLLLRDVRAAPGLDARGLRALAADGQVSQTFWAEWLAPPADLAGEALRGWLLASGRFSAITAPGSRLRAPLVLEAELLTLHTEPAARLARAGMAALLLADEAGRDGPRVLGQFTFSATAPLPAGDDPGLAAAAMAAALGGVLAQREEKLLAALPPPGRATR